MLTLRRPVAPAECDILGHMNVASYIAAMSDALFSVEAAVGLNRADMERRKIALVAAHIEADYRHELLAGDVLIMHSRVTRVGTKSAQFAHTMHRDDGLLAFEATNVSVLFDLTKRHAVAFPDDIRNALVTLTEEEETT